MYFISSGVVLGILCGLASTWTFPVSVDLAWPPLDAEDLIIPNGQLEHDPVFPCAAQPVPGDVQRVTFPASQARLQVDLINSTGQYANYYFVFNIYWGQMDVDPSANKSGWAADSQFLFEDFFTEAACTDPINATRAITEAPLFQPSTEHIVGTNATMGIRIILFERNGDNEQEMHQCSYVTFVADDDHNAGYHGVCNDGVRSASSTTSVIASATIVSGSASGTTFATVSASASSTPNGAVAKSSSHHEESIGIAVGVSLTAALVILGLGVWLVRRRKSRGTVALDFWTRGIGKAETEHQLQDIKAGKGKHIDDGKTSVRSSQRESVHSQQLPAYEEAIAEEVYIKQDGKKS